VFQFEKGIKEGRMDGFSDSFGGASTVGAADLEADPAAEFLAREQEDLAGLEDDIQPVVSNGLSSGQSSHPLSLVSKFGSNMSSKTNYPPLCGGSALFILFYCTHGDITINYYCSLLYMPSRAATICLKSRNSTDMTIIKR
jgi:hypothetical protein